MSRYLYEARLVPIGKPTSVRGDRGQPVTFTFDKHDFSVSRRLAGDVPVCLKHDPDLRIGNLRSLEPNRDWWVCCFELDEDLGIEFDVGQNVSVGLEWPLDDPGAPRMAELSIVRQGRVPGAEIMHRIPAPPAARQARPAVRAVEAPKPKPARQAATRPVAQPIVRRSLTLDEEEAELRRRWDWACDHGINPEKVVRAFELEVGRAPINVRVAAGF